MPKEISYAEFFNGSFQFNPSNNLYWLVEAACDIDNPAKAIGICRRERGLLVKIYENMYGVWCLVKTRKKEIQVRPQQLKIINQQPSGIWHVRAIRQIEEDLIILASNQEDADREALKIPGVVSILK